ncbi:YjhT family mutarotase [Escherichia coli]|nr:YjhT family mutarotase [Escherichia coli]EGK3991331.1 YjhT family mutarotase [Escherichia coli]ELC3350671.1 N-acetylneuraminate epimerase [Escherichia coli]HBI7651977.1 N-acetylneuraminate epimerase [Escherichia coli]
MKVKLLTAAITTMLLVSASHASVLPKLPESFKYGTGVILNDTVYIGLGSMGNHWYSINLGDATPKWTEIAAWPDVPREQATSTVVNGKIYVLGGTGKDKSGVVQVQDDVYSYDPLKNEWKNMGTRPPISLAGHISFSWKGQIISTGGVNKNIFNGYFSDINKAGDNAFQKNKINYHYFSKPVSDYFLNKQLITWDPETGQWKNMGEVPFTGTAGSSAIVDGNTIWLIGGERKPGLRTTAVWSGTLQNEGIKWIRLPPVASPDGVSGAYASLVHGQVLLAGGANFPGAASNYAKGKNWSHAGLEKHYSKDVYVLKNAKWTKAGVLPEGLAYGVSLPWKDGMLLIGGETTGGRATSDMIFISEKANKLIIQ